MKRVRTPEQLARYKAYQRDYQREYVRMSYWNDHDAKERMKRNSLKTARKNKLLVLTHYSHQPIPACFCCEEPILAFLTLDHPNNDGKADRKKRGSGSRLYQNLVTSGFPSGYRVLCWNCNCGRQVNGGECPHKENQ